MSNTRQEKQEKDLRRNKKEKTEKYNYRRKKGEEMKMAEKKNLNKTTIIIIP